TASAGPSPVAPFASPAPATWSSRASASSVRRRPPESTSCRPTTWRTWRRPRCCSCRSRRRSPSYPSGGEPLVTLANELLQWAVLLFTCFVGLGLMRQLGFFLAVDERRAPDGLRIGQDVPLRAVPAAARAQVAQPDGGDEVSLLV